MMSGTGFNSISFCLQHKWWSSRCNLNWWLLNTFFSIIFTNINKHRQHIQLSHKMVTYVYIIANIIWLIISFSKPYGWQIAVVTWPCPALVRTARIYNYPSEHKLLIKVHINMTSLNTNGHILASMSLENNLY